MYKNYSASVLADILNDAGTVGLPAIPLRLIIIDFANSGGFTRNRFVKAVRSHLWFYGTLRLPTWQLPALDHVGFIKPR
jgi:hypothetical protein